MWRISALVLPQRLDRVRALPLKWTLSLATVEADAVSVVLVETQRIVGTVVWIALGTIACQQEKPQRSSGAVQSRVQKAPQPPPHQPDLIGKPKFGPCDVRKYHAISISDWLPGGIVKRVTPEYPPEAQSKGTYGLVDVTIIVDHNGDVVEACGTGDPVLRNAGEAAARQWKFNVPALNGEKLPYVREFLRFNFTNPGRKHSNRGKTTVK